MSICNDYVNCDEIILQLLLVFKHMFSTFLFMRYSRRTLNCLERIALSNLTYMMIMVDPVTIVVKILRIDS